MTTLLIDADLYCYSTAIAFQQENPFTHEPEYNDILARSVLDERIRELCKRFGTHKVKCFFSCSRETNWRKTIVPSYKDNRKGTPKPIGLSDLITCTKEHWACVEEDMLEADDLLGIYSTDEELCKGETILCSWDKDMLTIPTTIYNSRKKILKRMTKVNAFKAFIYQVIKGDSADGYAGLYRQGDKKAKAFIFKHAKTLYNIWEPLLELAEKAGHDEEYLLSQARMAFILQKGFYDFNTKTIRLWSPEDIPKMLK